MKPIVQSIGVSNDNEPRHMVPIQLKNHTCRNRDQHCHQREEGQQHSARDVHVVRPDSDRKPGDGDRGEH